MPLLYAHRGDCRQAPENTLPAFERALDQGADGVELDVRVCRSGEVVVAHDPDLWRVSGDPTPVAELSLRALRVRDLGGGATVPTLDEALDLVLGRGALVNVEVKGDVPDRPGNARAVTRLLARRTASERERVVLSTFDPLTLMVLREAEPRIPTAFLFDAEHSGRLRAAVLRRWLKPEGLHPQERLVRSRDLRRWRGRGLFVNVWTVDDPARARQLAEADGLITNDVPALRAALG